MDIKHVSFKKKQFSDNMSQFSSPGIFIFFLHNIRKPFDCIILLHSILLNIFKFRLFEYIEIASRWIRCRKLSNNFFWSNVKCVTRSLAERMFDRILRQSNVSRMYATHVYKKNNNNNVKWHRQVNESEKKLVYKFANHQYKHHV